MIPPDPSTHQNSIVSFWSKPIRDRLSGSTLSPGQAAKRDLTRYHAIIDDALPAIDPDNAAYLVAWIREDGPPPELAAWHPIERLALLDASDRCLADLEREPDTQLADIVRRHFRLSGED